ncbi:MAG: SxtJ family membrane protein [Candidatus Omnitrophota bacterium]
MEKLNLDKKSLKNFGITMCIAFFIISGIIFIKQGRAASTFGIISLFFLLFGILRPNLLKPIYIFWMKLALVLSWVNTRIILFIIFYLIFAPIGLCMRLFGADLLSKKIEKTKLSYWNKKDNTLFNVADYQRQF